MNPFELFATWFAAAKQAKDFDATAMALATSDSANQPAVRIVLLKHFDERGFVFYTNLNSRKSQQLLTNPKAALCFYWPSLEKQIRIEGEVELVTNAEADIYFASRPRGSQIGAWASLQSQPLTSRDILLQRLHDYEEKFKNKMITRPENWSGFRVVPNYFEFWQQGEFRLHERISYRKIAPHEWDKIFLYP